MLAGVTYRQAFDAFGFKQGQRKFYSNHSQLVKAMKNLGCATKRKRFTSWDDIADSAIVPVNHRCDRMNFHWVVFDEGAIIDPFPTRPSRQRNTQRYRGSGWMLLKATHT
jgi:hypothetical protein